MSFQELFSVEIPNGVLVAYELPGFRPDFMLGDAIGLLPDEIAFCSGLDARRKISFAGGRLALRSALTILGLEPVSSLPNPRGAPIVPSGYRGSISHKDEVALAGATVDSGWTLGVDLEVYQPERSRIASKVLTDDELGDIEEMIGTDRWNAILQRFSLKEAIYKAIDPIVERYVSFKEVSVTLSGTDVAVDLRLKSPESIEIECEQFERKGLLISVARARLSPRA